MASDSFQFDHTNLQWQTWTGSVPNGAVSIYNEKCKRTEYVAHSGGSAGFYCPSMDQFCHYGYADKEIRDGSFEILVNKDDFEFLEWKSGSYGSVPENAVKTGRHSYTYVGRGPYGLGKVHCGHKAFFYPWEGKEYFYKHYEVLTFNRDIIKEEILAVKYQTDRAQIIQRPPEIIAKTIVENKNCCPTKHTTEVEQSVTESNSWSTNTNLTISTRASITAGVPSIASTTIEIGVEMSFGLNQGSSYTKSISRSVKVEHEVPPLHICIVRMEARMCSADIPFTAQLRRTYWNGKTTSTTINGTYKGVQVAEVRAVVEPSVPLKQH